MTDFLAAMAVVKVNYDRRNHDVLQMLVPFVADCARSYSTPLSDESIQTDLIERYGLPIPRTVVKSILQRLRRSGALKREHGVFVPVKSEIGKPEYDLSASLSDVRTRQANLLSGGTAFASRVFGVTVTEDDLSASIVSIVHREVAPLASWAVQGGSIQFGSDHVDELAQVAAQYILYVIAEGRSEDRIALEQIAKGSLLSSVLWSTDIQAPDRHIDGLEFYLDTTLILRLLGLCGPTRQAFSEELVALATQSGISLKCFEHTRDEVRGVLFAASAILRTGRSSYYGEAVEFMVTEGWGASDVEEVIASLDDRLNERGIELLRKPARETRYNMDEVGLRQVLNDNVHYTNPAALDADVDSLASIFVLRRARHSDRLELSRAVFVTSNSNLALGSRQLYKIGEGQLRGVPLALIETQIASYLWARRPNAADDLPLNLLAMGALSIAESDPRIWLKYVLKIDELRARERLTEREYVVLRQSLVARSMLLVATDNDVDAFTEDKAELVLRHALAEHARELQSEIRDRDNSIAESADSFAEIESQHRAQQSAFANVARTAAKKTVFVLGGLLALLLLAASAVSFPWPIDPPLVTTLPAWISIGLGLIAIFTAVLSVVVGFSLRGVGTAAIEWLARKLEKRYRARFAPSDLARNN